MLLSRAMAGGLGASTSKRIFYGYVLGGFVISLLSGLHQWASGGFATYLSQGWFHSKLTMVAVLLVMTVMLGGQVKKSLAGQPNPKLLMAIHGISGLCLVGIVFLTMVR